MAGKYDQNLELLCPICAGSQFAQQHNTDQYLCQLCGQISSYDDIIAANSERIEYLVDEIKSEALTDIKKQFKEITKRFGKKK